MKKFNVSKVYATADGLKSILALFQNLEAPKDSILDGGSFRSMLELSRTVIGYINEIGLPTAAMPFEELLLKINSDPGSVNYADCEKALSLVTGRFRDELSKLSFYHIQAERVKFYDGARSMFGEQVAVAFPSSIIDIEEAGRSLAVGRSTACVFHLMRCLSPVIKAIAVELAFRPNENWGPFLNEFRTEIWKKYPDDKAKANEEQRVFYSDLEQQLRAIKDAWRNPTMHSVAAVYTEEKAEEIFGYVNGLMRKAAEKLKEQP